MKKQISQTAIKRSSSQSALKQKSSRMARHPLASRFKRDKERVEDQNPFTSHRSLPHHQELLPKKKFKKKGQKPPKGGRRQFQKSPEDYSPNSCKIVGSHSSQPSSKSAKTPNSQIQGSRCDQSVKLYVRNVQTSTENNNGQHLSSLESSRYSQVRQNQNYPLLYQAKSQEQFLPVSLVWQPQCQVQKVMPRHSTSNTKTSLTQRKPIQGDQKKRRKNVLIKRMMGESGGTAELVNDIKTTDQYTLTLGNQCQPVKYQSAKHNNQALKAGPPQLNQVNTTIDKYQHSMRPVANLNEKNKTNEEQHKAGQGRPESKNSIDRLVRLNLKKNLDLQRQVAQKELKDFQKESKRKKVALADVEKIRKSRISRKENIQPKPKQEDQSISAKNSIVPQAQKTENQESKHKIRKVRVSDLGLDYLQIKKEIQKSSIISKPPLPPPHQNTLPSQVQKNQKSTHDSHLVLQKKKQWLQKHQSQQKQKLQEHQRVLQNLKQLNKESILRRLQIMPKPTQAVIKRIRRSHINSVSPRIRSSPRTRSSPKRQTLTTIDREDRENREKKESGYKSTRNQHSYRGGADDQKNEILYEVQDGVKLDAEEYNIFVMISDAATKIQRFYRHRIAKRQRQHKVKKHTFSFGGSSNLKHDSQKQEEAESMLKVTEVKQMQSPEKIHESLLRHESLLSLNIEEQELVLEAGSGSDGVPVHKMADAVSEQEIRQQQKDKKLEQRKRMYKIREVSPSKQTQTYNLNSDLNIVSELNNSKISLDAGSSRPEDSLIIISQAEKTDKIINYSSTSPIEIEINQSLTLSIQQVAVTLEHADHRSLMRLVSGDEKFNMSASGSCENSQLIFTEASLFEKKNPFAKFTLSKIQELLQQNHRQKLLHLKDQLLSYYTKINKVYKAKKQQRDTSFIELSSEISLTNTSTSVLGRWDDVWVGKKNYQLKMDSDARQIVSLKKKVDRIHEKIITDKKNKKSIESSEKKQAQEEPKNDFIDIQIDESEVDLEISIESDSPQQKQCDAICDQIMSSFLGDELLQFFDGLPRRDETLLSIQNDSEIVAGIDTSLQAVQAYIEQVFKQISLREEEFLHAFYIPVYRDPLTILAAIQQQNIGEGGLSIFQICQPIDLSESFTSILNVQLYLTIEKARETMIREAFDFIRESKTIDTEMGELLSEADHIHNKAIFDAINESMKQLRPYGFAGEPMPWLNVPRKKHFVLPGSNQLEDIISKVTSDVTEWVKVSSHPPRYFDPNSTSSQLERPFFNYFTSSLVKQDASNHQKQSIQQMLLLEVVKDNQQWTDYTMEQTQIKIDLADAIMEHLVKELLEILMQQQQFQS